MPIFLVTPIASNSQAVQVAVEGNIDAADRRALPNDAGWFVRFAGTTVELSNHLNITGQPKGERSVVGAAVVVLVGSYFGRGPTDMWEWLKTRFESES